MNKRVDVRADPFVVADGPKMESGYAPLTKFKPHPDNPRTHPQEEIDLLTRILVLRGPDQPIVVDEDWWILKGHGRLISAKAGKLKGFPFVQRFGLSDAEKRAIRIEDNQLGLLAGWDNIKLRADANVLKLSGYDMKLLGFGEQMTSWLTAGSLVENVAGEWGGMPQFQQDDKTAFRSIVVHFKDQKCVEDFGRLVKQKINDKTRFMWFPFIEIVPFVKVVTNPKAAPAKPARKKAAKK